MQEMSDTQAMTNPNQQNEAPARIFIKACHPESPNHNCTWSISSGPEDSVEYRRVDSPEEVCVACAANNARMAIDIEHTCDLARVDPPAAADVFDCGPARPDDGSECWFGFCPRPRDGCSEYCGVHHATLCVATPVAVGECEQEIRWEPLSPGSFNPEFSGYTAAPYCTGNPERGWCLYSRGAGACWNQRTKEQIAPRNGLVPQKIGNKWYWVESPVARAAAEIVEKTKCDEYRGGPHRTVMAADAVAAIITKHLRSAAVPEQF